MSIWDYENESQGVGDEVLSDSMGSWLNTQVEGMDDCPCRIFDAGRFIQNIITTKRIVQHLATTFGVGFEISYSVKTNPSADILDIAMSFGLGAECISLAELATVQGRGFEGYACTLNGPGKWWPRGMLDLVSEPMVVNCDSIGDLHRTIEVLDGRNWNSCVMGVRVSAPGTQTRFGIDLGDSQTVVALCGQLEHVPACRELGVHFHYAQSSLGTKAWVAAATAAVRQMSLALQGTFRRVVHFDLGGGWRAGDPKGLCEGLAEVCNEAMACFGDLRSFQLELGKMLVEDCGFVACRVLGRRGEGRHASLIVSAALSDVPDAVSFIHKVVWRKAAGGPWREFGGGHGCILGRLCMESDVIRRGVAVPDEICEDDIIVICDTGAYDTSMAFPFGAGALNSL